MAIAQILLMYEYIDLYAPIDKCKAVVKQIKKSKSVSEQGSVEVRRVKKDATNTSQVNWFDNCHSYIVHLQWLYF